jgi:large subunit ribosomal protein L14
MLYITNRTVLAVIDNTGVKRLRNIMIYGRHAGQAGQLGIGSLTSVRPRRKLKKGNLLRFLLIQSRKQLYRATGSYVKSLAFRTLLMKRQDFEPLANRLNGFIFLELRRYEEFRNTSLTVYLI